ncbi:hypothetical protein PPTG_08971 [Phytophthora nicotianae INRA-310]|uniref:Uncharacterized protein n=1 Tax=Phytophthora nicotianae (strain INRA-310) TaxID=761204 RepID=W2QIH8_PHYN3|nr:hypothetical protein PPTG_08971 [Phytophthora nicotianae INRA-310]ETN12973.1 hypothetical protein PPTG_08971 [Phytophthora nicotianae INRA-310]
MGTPDTVSMINRMCTPFNHPVRAASRAAERQTTASTVRLSYGGSIVTWTSGDDGGNDGDNDDEGEDERLPTFEACSRAIMAAAERMVVLTGQPRSLAVAIAYDECLDIVTAAVDHMDRIGLQGDLSGNLLEVYQSMHIIRELLQPSPPVRRALRF